MKKNILKIEITENFIRIPVRSKSEFIEDSFKTIDISQPRGIKGIIGRLKSDPEGPTKVKSYLFDKEKWTLAAAQAWVKENKSLNTHMKKQYLTGHVEKISDEDGTLDVAIATDSGLDRDGERIETNGWNFEDFLKNPVLLWAHNYSIEPIGKVLNIRQVGDKILFTPKFAVGVSQKATEIFQLFKGGFLNAFSVGFIPEEFTMEKDEKGNDVRVFTKVSMLEISAVPVPSNPRALVLARGIEGITDETIKEITEKLPKRDFKEVAKDMAVLLGMGGSKIEKKNFQAKYDSLIPYYELEKKEIPDFDLIEAQVLKEIDLDVDVPVVINIVKSNINPKPIARAKSKDGKGGKAPDKRSAISEVVKDAKRLLQSVDRSVGKALQDLKKFDS